MPIRISAGTALFGMSLTTIVAVVPYHMLGKVRQKLQKALVAIIIWNKDDSTGILDEIKPL